VDPSTFLPFCFCLWTTFKWPRPARLVLGPHFPQCLSERLNVFFDTPMTAHPQRTIDAITSPSTLRKDRSSSHRHPHDWFAPVKLLF
jgi:hypothetical protein